MRLLDQQLELPIYDDLHGQSALTSLYVLETPHLLPCFPLKKKVSLYQLQSDVKFYFARILHLGRKFQFFR